MREQRNSTRICIMGCTPYGISLANLFASNSSFGVMVFDDDEDLIQKNRELSDDNEINFEFIPSRIFNNNFYIIVSTNRDNCDNLTCVDKSFHMIKENASPGSVIVIESSIPLGKSQYYNSLANGSYTVAHSPIRWDSERTNPQFKNIPKVIASPNLSDLEYLKRVYGSVFTQVVSTLSYEVAEASNLLESAFRVVNISFINEFSNMCKDQHINPFDVLDISSTKPFGFMEFIPGIGCGGPHIGMESNLLIRSGGNTKWPLLSTAMGYLNKRPDILAGDMCNVKSVLVVGVGYKPNSSSWENSPVIPFIESLKSKNVRVEYVDPFIRDFVLCDSVDLPLDNPDNYDCVVVNHPYCLSYWANTEFKDKVIYYCHH